MQPRPPILTFQSCPWDNPQNCPLFICNKHRKNCECCPVSLLISCHNECHEFKFKSDFWDPIPPWLRVRVWDHKPTSGAIWFYQLVESPGSNGCREIIKLSPAQHRFGKGAIAIWSMPRTRDTIPPKKYPINCHTPYSP